MELHILPKHVRAAESQAGGHWAAATLPLQANAARQSDSRPAWREGGGGEGDTRLGEAQGSSRATRARMQRHAADRSKAARGKTQRCTFRQCGLVATGPPRRCLCCWALHVRPTGGLFGTRLGAARAPQIWVGSLWSSGTKLGLGICGHMA